VGSVTEQVVKGNDPHGGRGRICERDMACVMVGHGMAGQNCCVIGGYLLYLCLCRRGFQDLRSGYLLCSYCVGAFQVH